MKRFFAYLLICTMLLSLTACGEKAPGGETTPTAPEPVDALSQFRGQMKPPVMAVADFGFPDLSEDYDVMDFLWDEYPKWMQAHDFVANIPQERIVRTCDFDYWAQVVCIVPQDPAATVCVNVTSYTDEMCNEVLDTYVAYHSESGEPILLLATTAESVSVSVVITDSEGRGVSWEPYWEIAEPIPEDGFNGHLVMDFTPAPEKTPYERAMKNGWFVPDESFLTDRCWESDCGYRLELVYHPGDVYDGEAYLSRVEDMDVYVTDYVGYWCYFDGLLRLEMENVADSTLTVSGDFPVLTDPYEGGWLGINRTETGVGLPQFYEDMEFDELWPVQTNTEDVYQYSLSHGWYVPELWELVDTEWKSQVSDYAMDLHEDAVPGDNGGWAVIYDVDEIGAYTQSYTGAWDYADGMLHLSLVPEFDDGVFVDTSFPVLMQDGILWLGRNADGMGLPHFYADQLADTLEQPKG